jgi:NitT/TauT family transport system substrate-binding protein
MWMEDYGIQFYADTIITHEALMADDPDLVARFLAATLRGWRYAIEHPDEAVAMTLRQDLTLDPGRQARMMEAQTPLVHTGEVSLGWMRPGTWQAMHDLLLEHGILDGAVDLDHAYTTAFLPQAQGERHEDALP